VADSLGCSHTKLARVELGENDLPKVGDLEELMLLYDVDEREDRETLLTMHRDSLSKEPWMPYRLLLPSKMPTFLGLEQDATEMRAYQPSFVFGLLQSEKYVRSIYAPSKPVEEFTTEFVERHVQLRLARKEVITRDKDPLRLHVIMDEAVLRRRVGPPEVMRDQYDEIAPLPTATVGIRDSKDRHGPTLAVPAGAWTAFVTEIR
jgi:hypothetical protein